MKIFLDTANIEQIREAASLGLVDGVTTNPTLISREEGKFEDVVREICEIVDGPVSAEVVSLDAEGMVEEAKKLTQIHENVVIKIPMTREGVKALHQLRDLGIEADLILFLVDAAQSAGILETDVRTLGIDALAVGGQKGLLGLYGIGFLYCRRAFAERLTPVFAAKMYTFHEPDPVNSAEYAN